MMRPARRDGAGPNLGPLALILATAILVLQSLASAGCYGGPATVITSPVTINFWHSQRGSAAEVLETLAAQFSEDNPNITVRLVYRPGGGEMVRALESAGPTGVPAIAEVPEWSVLPLAQAGTIVPLQEYAGSRSYGLELGDRDDFWPCLVAANASGRQLWGMPWSHKAYALVYNTTLVPKPPATWNELKEMATALTRRSSDPAESTFGLAICPSGELFCLALLGCGGTLLSSDPWRSAFDTPEGVAALDEFFELACVRRAVLQTMGDPSLAVASGRAAMAIAPVGWPSDDGARRLLGVAPVPGAKVQATIAPGTSLVLPSGRNPAEMEAAWRFARWLTSRDVAARWSSLTGDVPVRRSAVGKPSRRDGNGHDSEQLPFATLLDSATALTYGPNWEAVERVLRSAVAGSTLGESGSSQAVLDAAAATVDEILAGGQ